jgi:hypothetical protein
VFHQGAGTTQFAIGVDVLTPGIKGGGAVFDAIGVHVRPQVGAQNNFGLAIDGTYGGPNDYAIQTNANARSKFGSSSKRLRILQDRPTIPEQLLKSRGTITSFT